MLHKSCSCDIMWWRDQLKENKLLSYTKTVKSTSTVKDCLRWLSCPRCMIHHFPPPSPSTSGWSILEHSPRCKIFEIFVLQCSIQWWAHDKVVLTFTLQEKTTCSDLELFLPVVYKLITWSCACNSSHPAHKTGTLVSEKKLPISMNSGITFLYALCMSAQNTRLMRTVNTLLNRLENWAEGNLR